MTLFAAVQPGINRICLKLRLKPDNLTDLASPNANHGSASNHPSTSKASIHPPSPYASVAFDDSDMPPKEIYEPLLEVFFECLAQHFPSIQRYRLQKRLANGTMSAFLLNGKSWWNSNIQTMAYSPSLAVCAISARFASNDKAYHANVRSHLNRLELTLIDSLFLGWRCVCGESDATACASAASPGDGCSYESTTLVAVRVWSKFGEWILGECYISRLRQSALTRDT